MAEDDKKPPSGDKGGEAAIRAAPAQVVTLPPAEGRDAREAGTRGTTPLDLANALLELNDIGNAERLIARYGDDLLYVEGLDWFVWEGRYWKPEGPTARAAPLRRMAHMTAREILCECQAAGNEGMRLEKKAAEVGCPVAERGALERRSQTLLGAAERLWKWSTESGDRSRISAMIGEAQPYLTVKAEALDCDKRGLNLENGYLRLDGACDALLPHAREQFAAKMMPLAYDPEAQAPLWRAFLEEVQPDPRVRGLLQSYAGYCLTGDTGEQVLVFNFGAGANGKSVFVDTLAEIMGDYACSLPFSSLVLDERKRGGEPTPDLARLPGRRLVRAAEPEKGSRLAEATIKEVTGGERMTVRHLHGPYFEFKPEFKLMLSGNHKPVIRGTDHAIWRRLLLVPWGVTIPPERQDETLKERLWAERAGILNWMLDGCRIWLERGLQVPESVMAATESFREESDPLGAFVAQCLVEAAGEEVQAQLLYETYVAWCKVNGERSWGSNNFTKELEEKGWRRAMLRVRMWQNMRLVNLPMATNGTDEPPPAASESDYD